MIQWLGPEDFPEPRREALLRRYAWQAQTEDPMALAALVAARSARPCAMAAPGAEVSSDRLAVLGDDGRFHLRVAGRFICADPWPGRRRPVASAVPHRQWCSWWTADGLHYRVNPPRGTQMDAGRHGSPEVRWAVLPTGELTDPALVPKRRRCPSREAYGDWPPYRGAVLAPIVNALTASLGATCQACCGALGVFVDHDAVTMLVRGLVCRHCNTHLEECPHASGCRWGDYLNDPPAAPLGLRYPRAAASRTANGPRPAAS
ncbi:endonuclease domain-containing protein [Sphaerisporangium sp. NPDC088356]|uniref:endonuclease domain-containing protein n=1 Tax=Sphaerisporangium sp. NPDC088356 TaxID=3154871 RepID=UPI0034473507